MTPTAWLYLAITALAAACGLVIEIVAGRIIAPYLGMSLYTWTAIIAVVLAGFSIGHWIGGRIAEGTARAARRGVAWSLLLAALSAAASLVLLRLLSGPIIGLGLAPVPTILMITAALFFLPSLFVGIPSPVLTKLAIDESPGRIGRLLGMFYAAGAVGSIVGTLAAGYLFISWLGSIRTVLLVAGLYLVMGLALLATERGPRGRRSLSAPLAAVLVLSGLLALAGRATLAFTTNCDRESDYSCIRVIDVSDQIGTAARVLVLDHLGHGINLRDRPRALATPYVEAQDALARLHAGRGPSFRVFFIGGGAYTLPRAWLAARADAEVTVAEIDPAVTEVARRRMWLGADARLVVRHADARRVLMEGAAARYDVIVGDAFHDIGVPQHLVTREFFALVASRLADDGIYLMNVVDRRDRPRLALSVLKSLQPSFPVVELWRSNETGVRSTFVIAGLRRPTPVARLPSRLQPGLAYARFAADHVAGLSARLGPLLLTDDFAPVGRLIGVE